tara:strand:+ start:7063 stop:7527 length:465 start_codon:yes stop_codon:yes gene_type:complete
MHIFLILVMSHLFAYSGIVSVDKSNLEDFGAYVERSSDEERARFVRYDPACKFSYLPYLHTYRIKVSGKEYILRVRCTDREHDNIGTNNLDRLFYRILQSPEIRSCTIPDRRCRNWNCAPNIGVMEREYVLHFRHASDDVVTSYSLQSLDGRCH